jgi:hypothetical protein
LTGAADLHILFQAWQKKAGAIRRQQIAIHRQQRIAATIKIFNDDK